MILVKKGHWHTEYGTNCQDAAVEFTRIAATNKEVSVKCIVDGCSQGEHSEVGAQLFCLLFKRHGITNLAFEEIRRLFTTPGELLDYALFTHLYVTETEKNFHTIVCGDGYIILQDYDDKITYEKFEYGGAPPYYAYNYFPKDKLKKYQDGVEPKYLCFSKEKYKAVGVASDGLQYILDSEFKKEFEELLIARKVVALKRFINKHAQVCKDDVSIAI